MSNPQHAHDLPVNDISHCWTEDRRGWREADDGTIELDEPFTVYVGVCTCGHRMEGKNATAVTHQWLAHRRTEDV